MSKEIIANRLGDIIRLGLLIEGKEMEITVTPLTFERARINLAERDSLFIIDSW
jgi:hypothetical protein